MSEVVNESPKPAVNVENMRTFVSALLSGKYKQCKGSLRTLEEGGSYSYCCLGVATQCALDDGVPEGEDGCQCGCGVGDSVWGNGHLPPAVRKWLGVDESNPLLDFTYGQRLRASIANDDYGQDFYAIGRAFERTFLTNEEDD